jgi:hypothetical protein
MWRCIEKTLVNLIQALFMQNHTKVLLHYFYVLVSSAFCVYLYSVSLNYGELSMSFELVSSDIRIWSNPVKNYAIQNP